MEMLEPKTRMEMLEPKTRMDMLDQRPGQRDRVLNLLSQTSSEVKIARFSYKTASVANTYGAVRNTL